ncbi:MAG: sulfotransferase [Gammaproteobacteria bacterium]|nr:sulfotransferase [Gammaproteobacteria bacterium]
MIVGAPKCGTTSMAQYLNEHPHVHMIRGEPHYFATDLRYNSPPMTERQYLRLCRATGGKPVCGERSTWYLYSRVAAAHLHQLNPQARIIAIIRNPADMLYSLHAHYMQRTGCEDQSDLMSAMALETYRRRGHAVPAGARFPQMLYYSEIPRYSEQLQRYFHHFGREQVHVILFDDVRSDPETVYRRTLEFLDLDSDYRPEFRVYNRSAPVRDTWLRRLWKRGTWRYHVRSMIPQRLHDARVERRRRRREMDAGRQPWPPMPCELRAHLTEQFRDEIARLEDLLQRDLSAWRSHQHSTSPHPLPKDGLHQEADLSGFRRG